MIPWWKRIIDPQALVALAILAAAFGLIWVLRRYRVSLSIVLPTWEWRVNVLEGPWPVHIACGCFFLDVTRRS